MLKVNVTFTNGQEVIYFNVIKISDRKNLVLTHSDTSQTIIKEDKWVCYGREYE